MAKMDYKNKPYFSQGITSYNWSDCSNAKDKISPKQVSLFLISKKYSVFILKLRQILMQDNLQKKIEDFAFQMCAVFATRTKKVFLTLNLL